MTSRFGPRDTTYFIIGEPVYSALHDQLPPSPFSDIQICYAHPISLNCHQLYVVIVANGYGYTQGPFRLPWSIALVGQENQIKDVRFLFSPFSLLTTPPLWPPKREYNAVSAERSMEFGNIVQVETLRYLTKITALRKKVARARFLQPSIWLRYNYHVQLVAIKRYWIRVPNLIFRSAR